MMIRQGLGMVLTGLAVGLAVAVAGGRVMQDLLFETPPGDPLTLTGVSLVLLAAATAACLVPARRATRVSPTTALRSE